MTDRLIRRAGNENIASEVQCSDLVHMGLQRENFTVSHAAFRGFDSVVVGVLKGNSILVIITVFVVTVAVRVVA